MYLGEASSEGPQTLVLRTDRFKGTYNVCIEDKQVQGEFELLYLGQAGAAGPRTSTYVKP